MGAWGRGLVMSLAVFGMGGTALADGTPYAFSTGSPDGRMGMASRPASAGKIEIEAADDFALADQTSISGATLTGLMPSASTVGQVRIEIYRVFPIDSDAARTITVPVRTGSPADVVFAARDSADGSVTFTTSTIGTPFTVANSVLNGIHPKPGQTTGGDGTATGNEVKFTVTLTKPFDLPPGHYFLVPEVQVSTGDFYWLSAPSPTVSGDAETWIRDANLAPDWLRVGTDIVGGATKFNGSFSLSGVVCPVFTTANQPPAATLGAPYSATLSVVGGAGPFSFSEAGVLPSGVSLSPAGVLSGTPTQAGTFPIAVTVSEPNGCTETAPVTVSVVAPATSTPTTPTTPPLTGPTTVRLSALRVTPSAFTAAHGAVVSFSLDRAARVSFTLTRLRPGGRGRHQRCERPRRTNRHARRCVLTTVLGPGFVVSGRTGANRFTLSRAKLVPGRYGLIARPRNGAASRASFTVKSPARHRRK